MSTAVFLDRDNTLIHNDDDLGKPDDVDLIQGAASAIGSLCGLGYKVVVVTNQGGVARGQFTEQDVDQVHARIRELVRTNSTGADVERFYYCPYHPEGTVKKYKRDHAWRKPRPGMLLQAAKDMDLDLSQCWMIGDKLRDVRAGAAAGTRTILLRDPKKKATTDDDDAGGAVVPDFVAVNLIAAVRIVAQQRHPESADQIGANEPASKRWSAAAAAAMKRKPPDTSALATTIRAVEPPAPKASRPGQAARPFRPWNAPSAPEPQTPPPPKHATKAAAPTNAPAAPKAEPEKNPVGESQPPADNLTLRQILQELRNQRSGGSDFSYLSMLAIVLQMVALVCLLAAFFLGGSDQDSFVRWISTAVLIQLATIATLKFGR